MVWSALLLPFLLLPTQHCISLQNLSLIKSLSVVLIKSAVDTQCYLEGVVGLLREVLTIACLLCVWK